MSEERGREPEMPPTAAVYLSLWGLPITPDGEKMTVAAAAKLAGVSVSAVKHWRDRIPGFRDLEVKARKGQPMGYAQNLARGIVGALVGPAGKRLAHELEKCDGDWRAGLEVLKLSGQFKQVIDMRQRVHYTPEELAQAADELEEWERDYDMGTVDQGAEQPPISAPES